MAPSLDHSMELLLKGVRKLAEAYTDLEVLEEVLRIINWKQYVSDQLPHGQLPLRDAWFSQAWLEEGEGFIKLVPVWWQTLVTLVNLGTSGNGGDHFHLARMFNCSEGSIQNWSKQCQVLKSQIEQCSFFRDCVGFVDGT
ncbi:hypothetical protein CROQUDRAFT_667116, partial [Cronartium quercuum f. sp. fusiforme G11]